jgi:HlyD family secretion protein
MILLKNKKGKYIITTLLVLLFLIGLKFGCKKDNTPKVAIEKAQIRTIIETVDETGKIFPSIEMKISADLGSVVTEIYVQDGDTVKQGQAIAQMQVDGTSIVAGKSINPMQNVQKAMQGGQMNPTAIAQALQQAQQPAPSPSIQKTTKYTTLYAPMNGIISDLMLKKGERVMGSEIAKVVSINDWEVRASIGEIDIVKIKEGNTVKVNIDAIGNKELLGTVYRISNNVSTGGLGSLSSGMMADATNYKVFIKINSASLSSINDSASTKYHLRSGMNASIKIETNKKSNVLSIPIKAVTTRFKNELNNESATTKKQKSDIVVFVVENGIAMQKVVNIGIQDMEYVEILAGVEKDATIIVEPFDVIDKVLNDKQKIKAVASKDLFKK